MSTRTIGKLTTGSQYVVDIMAQLSQNPGAKKMADKPLWLARKEYRGLFANFGAAVPPDDLVHVAVVPGASTAGCVSSVCFSPKADRPVNAKHSGWPLAGTGGALPLVFYFHGGGWTVGDTVGYDSFCRTLCLHVGACVVAVDYRLGPEHRCPAAAEDCYASVAWAATDAGQAAIEAAAGRSVDPTRIGIAGDSAGGNLTAVTCLMAKERSQNLLARIRLQLLLCPSTDLRPPSTQSHKDFEAGYFLDGETMRYFRKCYTGDDETLQNTYAASPLLAKDLSGLPRACVFTASHDPLVDEGKQFADRLAAAGVPTTYRCYEGQIHVFWMLGKVIPEASTCNDDIALALRSALAPSVRKSKL